MFVAGIVCKYCLRDIPLPIAKRPCLSPDRSHWPHDCASRNFLCLGCARLCTYSAEDVFCLQVESAHHSLCKPDAVVCIEINCSTQRCRCLLRVYAVMPCDPDPLVEASAALPAMVDGEPIYCGHGHLQNFDHRRMGFDMYFDHHWAKENRDPLTSELVANLKPYLLDVSRQFKSDAECMAYLESLRWPDGIFCPLCGSKKISRTERKTPSKNKRIYFNECLSCKGQFSATTGTIFQGSHIPLRQWFAAIALVLDTKRNISPDQLRKYLNLAAYRTAWYLRRRIFASIGNHCSFL